MAEERFDCIIVGGGLAGLSAAYVLANAGLETLLVERGNYSGAKNVTGGRLYGHSLEQLIPNFAASAPIERTITKERISLLRDFELQTGEYASSTLTAPQGESYSVLRAKFDAWLSEQAEEAGAMLVQGVRVDDLLLREGRVCGVIAADEEMEADVVILADGVNSPLALHLGSKQKILPSQAAVGAKEIIELGEDVINQRFELEVGEGLAWFFSAENYDAFLFTNQSSISLGVTVLAENIAALPCSVPQLLEDFKQLPEIAALISGGRMVEYSAHLLPEGGEEMIPQLVGDGVLLAGDAAALCTNLGFTVRGMDLAIESGRLAAEAVLQARESGDFSAATLASYEQALQQSFIMPCMRGFKACHQLVKQGKFNLEDPAADFNAAMQQAGIE